MSSQANLTKYTLNELLEALDSIDAVQYLDRAKVILNTIKTKTNMSSQELIDNYASSDNPLITNALSVLLGMPISTESQIPQKIRYIDSHSLN